MKKRFLIILSIIIVLFIIIGLVTSYIDSARVRNSIEPKFTVKIVSDDGDKVTYWGIGYKVIRYPSVSPEEPYKNNRGVKYGSWFMKYELSKEYQNKESNYKETEVKNVSISISDISLTGATIMIKDTNKQPYIYGEWYQIEKEVNGKWYELETLINNYGFNEIGYEVNEKGEVKFIIDWKKLYGELSLGSYRILKQVNNKYIFVEFSIATTSNIEVIKSELTNLNKFNKYLERDNRIIYLAENIEDINYIESDIKISLKDYITKSYQTTEDGIKNLINTMKLISTLRDGGTKIYKSDNNDITIVKCNTISGNKDIYIGDYSMNFDSESMCK